MRLEVAVFLASAILVSNVLGQDLNLMLRLMGMDPIPLPPTPPKSLFPQLYQPGTSRTAAQPRLTPQQLQLIQQQLEQKRRDEQENQILRRLQSLSPQQLKQLQDNLTPEQLKQLVSRIQYLKQKQELSTTQKSTYAPADQNTIISMANRVRQLRDPNAINVAGSAATTRMPAQPARGVPRQQPLHEMHQLHSYHKKAHDAHAAGCRHPMGMGAMETALMFRSCSNPAANAACMGVGGQCVNMGVSIMCCPFGYNSRVIDAVNYMRRMDQFMQQIS